MNIGHILRSKGNQIRSINPQAPLTEAVSLMVAYGTGSLVVMRDGDVISIVTERDILCAANDKLNEFHAVKVEDVMAKQLVTCHSQYSINDAMDLMTNNLTGRRIRHLPVIDDGELVGVVSIGDIVHALLKEVKFENKLLKNYIRNWPEEEET